MARNTRLKLELGTRLKSLMKSDGRNWNQSDLARQSGLTRCSISNYVIGDHLPTAKSLVKLAKAFGMTPDELLPKLPDLDDATPSFSFTEGPNDTAYLRINRLVSMDTAMQISALLRKDIPMPTTDIFG